MRDRESCSPKTCSPARAKDKRKPAPLDSTPCPASPPITMLMSLLTTFAIVRTSSRPERGRPETERWYKYMTNARKGATAGGRSGCGRRPDTGDGPAAVRAAPPRRQGGVQDRVGEALG